ERVSTHLDRAVRRRLGGDARHLDALSHRLHRCHPGVMLRQHHQRLDELEACLRRYLLQALEARRIRVNRLAAAVAAANPKHRVAGATKRGRVASGRLEQAMARRIERLSHRLTLTDRALRSLSPLATLDRGYAIIARQDDQRLVTDSTSIAPKTGIVVRLAR